MQLVVASSRPSAAFEFRSIFWREIRGKYYSPTQCRMWHCRFSSPWRCAPPVWRAGASSKDSRERQRRAVRERRQPGRDAGDATAPNATAKIQSWTLVHAVESRRHAPSQCKGGLAGKCDIAEACAIEANGINSSGRVAFSGPSANVKLRRCYGGRWLSTILSGLDWGKFGAQPPIGISEFSRRL